MQNLRLRPRKFLHPTGGERVVQRLWKLRLFGRSSRSEIFIPPRATRTRFQRGLDTLTVNPNCSSQNFLVVNLFDAMMDLRRFGRL